MMNSAITKKVIAIVLTVVTVMSMVACSGEKATDKKDADDKTYTYNTYVMKGEEPMDTVRRYTEMGLVDVKITSDGSWAWSYEMAESIADVTAAYADKEKWGIPAEATGRVWEIKLNKKATFEEGTAITADTYIDSLKLVLSGNDEEAMGRFVDVDQYDTALVGAYEYSMNDMAGQAIYGTLAEAGYSTVDKAIEAGVTADTVMLDVYKAFGIICDTESGMIGYQDTATELVDVKGALGTAGAKVTAKALYDGLFAKGAVYEAYAKDYIYVPTGNQYPETHIENVGLVKVDDYTLYYITEASVSQFEMFQAMRENWITYDATQTADTEVSDAETSTDSQTDDQNTHIYVSYGPYKLMAYRDKEVKLTKNEKWYGYTDGNHDNQFQTTDIVIDVLSSQAEVIQLYESGQLDYVELGEENMAIYAESPYKHVRDTEYVYRWVFATELDDLIALEVSEGQGNNKRVLYYDDFRKAMSLAIDRDAICEISGVNYNSANYLVNESYYTDIAHNQDSIYREVVAQVGGEETASYDVETAKTLFQSVYEQAILNKNYTDGQKIQINCIVGDHDTLTEKDKAEEKALNEMLAAATVGTGFDGKINVTYKCSDVDRYRACANGEIEMIKSAWGGDVYDPFTLIRCYTDPEYVGVVQESCGWDPTTEKVTITYDLDGDGTEDTVAKSFAQWTRDIQLDGVYGADTSARTHILSCIERSILSAYQCIPWGTATEWTLVSEKVEYGPDSYNSMYEYGGVRYITYNYDDKAWKAYLKESK